MTKRPGRLVLLGHPVSHSLSPIFQNAALRASNIPLVYEALDVSGRELRSVLRQLKTANAAGNVTIPHKIAVHDLCDDLTDLAAKVGAVNTFWFDSKKLHGDNTDVGGFDAAARALLGGETTGARIVVLGAGGAAAAVLAAAEEWPDARVTVVARHNERAAALAKRFPDVARAEKSVERAVRGATLIVNATPIGQQDEDQPVDVELIPKSAAVLDLVYRRGGTQWVKTARENGIRAADGLPMLLEQGALAFQRWFGSEPDREAMRLSLP
ncbi:MAG TPA: shikimate dehydrogenase [Gemmatimonadaceae bacterium]|nr:shikimate dehydrogenase [Gemmatimonadaceae bacterium]